MRELHPSKPKSGSGSKDAPGMPPRWKDSCIQAAEDGKTVAYRQQKPLLPSYGLHDSGSREKDPESGLYGRQFGVFRGYSGSFHRFTPLFNGISTHKYTLIMPLRLQKWGKNRVKHQNGIVNRKWIKQAKITLK